MLGMNFDYGTITISSNVSGFSYSLNSQDYTCGQSSCTQTLRPGIYNVIASKEEFFDINTKSSYHPRVVEIFNSWGFAWGGTWTSPDEMHFELRDLSASISKTSG